MFEIEKVQYVALRKDLKRGADSAPPDRNGTLKFFKVFKNFTLFAQKIEQKLLQTPNYSFLFIDTLKSTFEMINCMSMRFFKTGNIFVLFGSGGSRFCSIGYYFFEYLTSSVLIFHMKVHIKIHKVAKNCTSKCVEQNLISDFSGVEQILLPPTHIGLINFLVDCNESHLLDVSSKVSSNLLRST